MWCWEFNGYQLLDQFCGIPNIRKEFSVSGKKHVLRGGTSVDIRHVGPTAMQKLLDGKPKGIIAQL